MIYRLGKYRPDCKLHAFFPLSLMMLLNKIVGLTLSSQSTVVTMPCHANSIEPFFKLCLTHLLLDRAKRAFRCDTGLILAWNGVIDNLWSHAAGAGLLDTHTNFIDVRFIFVSVAPLAHFMSIVKRYYEVELIAYFFSSIYHIFSFLVCIVHLSVPFTGSICACYYIFKSPICVYIITSYFVSVS